MCYAMPPPPHYPRPQLKHWSVRSWCWPQRGRTQRGDTLTTVINNCTRVCLYAWEWVCSDYIMYMWTCVYLCKAHVIRTPISPQSSAYRKFRNCTCSVRCTYITWFATRCVWVFRSWIQCVHAHAANAQLDGDSLRLVAVWWSSSSLAASSLCVSYVHFLTNACAFVIARSHCVCCTIVLYYRM